MRVVVTGGAGFVGSALCRHLIAEHGTSVLSIDKDGDAAASARLASIACNPRFRLRRADVCDRSRVRALLDAFEPDAVVHVAREGEDGEDGGAGAGAYIRTNVVGTFGMIEAVRDHWSSLAGIRRQRFRFVQVSSAAVFGPDGGTATSTNAPLAPASPFAASMAAADQLVMAWHRSFALPAMIAAPTSTYGAYQSPDRAVAKLVIGAIANADAGALQAEPRLDEPLLVDDLARAIEAMLRRGMPGATYVLGGGSVRTQADIGRRVRELVERHRTRWLDTRARAFADSCSITQAAGSVAPVDSSPLLRDTGWRAEETLESGLSRTVRWYLGHETWWRAIAAAHDEGARQGMLKRA